MSRATRRSSIFQLPTAGVVEEKRITGSSFDTKFSLPSFIRKVEKLTDDQRAAIIKTGFGNLLNIHNQMISKVLLNELIERWDSENMAFMLPHGELTITAQDVALILGLRVVGKPVVLDSPFSDLEQEYGATPLNRKISISSLEDRLESIGGLVNEDFIRTFVLCTFGVFLFPNSSGKVDSRFLTLLKDLDMVHEYAWGEAVREELFSWIQRRKEENVRFVGGCLLLLQVWYYEHIDIGRPSLLVPEQFPRASRWESIRSSSFQRQSLSTKMNKLEEDQITWVLQPTTRESEMDVVKHFLEDESATEEVPDSEVSDSECDDSVAYHPETKDIVPTECAPNEDLNTEVHFREEICSDPPDAPSDVPVSCKETKEVVESQNPPLVDSDKGMQMDIEPVSEASGPSLDMPVSKSPAMPSCNSEDKECLHISSIKIGTPPIQTQDHGPEDCGLQEQQLQGLKKDIDVLKKENDKLKAENGDLKKKSSLIPRLQEESCTLKAEIEDLKKGNSLIPRLQEENCKLKAENEDLMKENPVLKEELGKLKAENEDLKQQMLADQIGLERLLYEYYNP